MDNHDVNGKTSNDIIAELFSTFDAEPPVIPEATEDESTKKGHSSKKSKKSKKKHKKHKKKRRASTSDSESSPLEENKSKRKKLNSHDASVSDTSPALPQPAIVPETEEKSAETEANRVEINNDLGSLKTGECFL